MGYPLTAGRRLSRLAVPPPWARYAVGAGGMAAVIAGTWTIAMDAASGGSPLVDDGNPVPSAVLGPLAGHGGSFLYAPRFWTVLLLMFGGYALLTWGGSLPAKPAIAGIVALHVIALEGPPIASDVFSYIDYARLGVLHGVNPYAHSPAFVRTDPLFGYVGHLWLHMPSAYGPLFTLVSYPVALLGLAAGVELLKALAVVSSLGLVAVTAGVAQRRGGDPVRAALLVGVNPILVVFGVEAAHNDLPMLALAMLGVWLAVRGRPAWGGAGVVLAAGIKASAAIVLPFMLLGTRQRLRTAGGAAVAAVATALGAVAVFGGHAFAFASVLQRQQLLVTPNSAPSEIARLFGQSTVSHLDRTLLHVLLACSVVYLLVRVWRGADWISGAGWALLVAALTTTWMLSWYMLWALPFAAVGRDRRLLVAVFFIQALYLVHRALPALLVPA